MTDNAAGTHSKVIGSSPSSSPLVWTYTVPGADTVAWRACRIADPRQAEVRAAPSYATQMNGLADEQDLRLRFDVLTKTKQPELCRYWTTRDRAANVRLFRLAAEILQAIEAGVFHPNPGWQCKDCQFRSQCWAWR